MGLRFDPVGGGQFKQAVKQIIDAESQPLRALEARKAREDARLKLFQEFRGKFGGVEKALAEISNFKKFRELKADLGDGANFMGVTIDREKAEPGTYTIQIEQLAARTSAISNGFADSDDPSLGTGFITIDAENGDSIEIFVDSDQSSLNGIATMINKEPGSLVRAAVIRDASEPETPWKLILSAKKEGYENHLSFPDFYFLDGVQDLYIDDDRSAQNARILVDGFPIELNSNAIADFLPGVSVQLKQARPDVPFTLQIVEDTQKTSGKVKALVEQVNQVLQFITKQNAIDERSDTRTTFAGDTSLQNIEYRIRNLFHEGFIAQDKASEEMRLVFMNEMGIEFDKTGQLQFKEDKFVKALESNYDAVSEAITGEFGFAYQFSTVLGGYTRSTDGMLSMREKGLRNRIKEIDNQIDGKARILERRQQALTTRFSKLEASLAHLQQQQQYLSAAMPSAGGGNIVSQLLGG